MRLKQKLSITILLVVILLTLFPIIALAANETPTPQPQTIQTTQAPQDDPINQLEKIYKDNNSNAWKIALGFLTPGITVVQVLQLIGGIILLVIVVPILIYRFIMYLAGKKPFGKKEIITLVSGVVLGLLIVGNGWFGWIKFTNHVGVKPLNDTLLMQQTIDQITQQPSQQTKTGQ